MRRSLLPSSEERRGLSLADAHVEIRAAEHATPRFFGHAAVFNSRTAIGNPLTWGFYEEIAPGAFTKTLAERDVAFLIDHSSSHIVARVSAGDLSLSQDDVGLATDAELDTELSYVRDLRRNLEKRRITGMSFGFHVPKDKDEWTTETVRTADGAEAEVEVRVIREVQLIEVSAVSFPAYQATDAAVRALRHRGDVEAIARRAQFRPELAELLDEVKPSSFYVTNPAATTEPGESTRDSGTNTTETTPTEPAEPTPHHAPSVSDRMRALAARHRLPVA